MRSIFFALPLLAATVAVAQTQSPNQSHNPQFPAPNLTPTQPHIAMIFKGCPVGFTAQQRSSGQTLWTIALEDQNTPKERLSARPSDSGVHVELRSGTSSKIKQVELVVSYIAPGGYLIPADTADLPTLKKTFNLSAEDGAKLKLTGDLLVGPAASITRVRLLSITYADGHTWQPEEKTGACSIEPNRLILVDAQ